MKLRKEQVQGKMQKSSKRRAPSKRVHKPKTIKHRRFPPPPFHEEIDPDNRWVILSKLHSVGRACIPIFAKEQNKKRQAVHP